MSKLILALVLTFGLSGCSSMCYSYSMCHSDPGPDYWSTLSTEFPKAINNEKKH